MRVFLAAAALAAVLSAPAARAADPLAGVRVAPGMEIARVADALDEARARRVAERLAASVAAYRDVAWTDGSATGTALLGETESSGCRTFLVRQSAPAGSQPFAGEVCLRNGAWLATRVTRPPAAGPGGEARAREAEAARGPELSQRAEMEAKVARERAQMAEKDLLKAERDRAFAEKKKADDAFGGGADGLAREAPVTRGMGRFGAPAQPAPGTTPMSTTIAQPKPAPGKPPAASAPQPAGGANGGIERTLAAVLVEIGPKDARSPRNGGSAVVLLSERSEDGARNLKLCRALFRALDTATTREIATGERKTAEGDIEKLRPVYWLWKVKPTPAADDACPARIANYDFARAYKVRTKYGLTGRGPYLVIARSDEQRAGVVDLGAAQEKDADDLVRYFRDGFSQDKDIWQPERHTPARANSSLMAFLGRAVPSAAITTLIRPVATAACPLGDFFDVCTSAPR